MFLMIIQIDQFYRFCNCHFVHFGYITLYIVYYLYILGFLKYRFLVLYITLGYLKKKPLWAYENLHYFSYVCVNYGRLIFFDRMYFNILGKNHPEKVDIN